MLTVQSESNAHEQLASMPEIREKLSQMDAIGGFIEFFGEEAKNKDDYEIQKNACSRLHKLSEAITNGKLISTDGESNPERDISYLQMFETFVIQHDWDAVMGTQIDDDEIQMPYDHTAFEFMMSGHTVIALVAQGVRESTGEYDRQWTLMVESKGYWITHETDSKTDFSAVFAQKLWDQVKAVCAFLDAEVIKGEIVRAPHKLNAARERKGKVKINDYRVLDVSRKRPIYEPVDDDDDSDGTKVRLHFRRGHWRHYKNHKTWVKWCLVGNPDLGFINKEYRL